MRLPKFEHFAPESLDEALALLDRYGVEAMILAGGTDLLTAAKLGNVRPRYVISLRKILELKGLNYREGDGLRIGALTPLHHIRHDPMVGKYSALAQAAAFVGAPHLQRMGTIGGNICLDTRCFFYNQSSDWRRHRPVCFKMGGDMCHVVPTGKKCFAVFSADTPPALMALDAKLKLVSSRGDRVVPIKIFYTGNGKEPVALHAGEILTEIHLPAPPAGQASIYLKYRIRRSIDFPLVGVALRVLKDTERSVYREAHLVLNAVGPAPVNVTEAEDLLIDSNLSEKMKARIVEMAFRAAHPVANVDSTASYRRQMAGILTRKALEALSLY